ncbi:RICIN domain-containing protein [Streptomyces sp. SP17BM10]|uniref:RICIN domain-containing protein n=1 Tax=Streptomyces sp. SP17BM10 TaxID=3002530 RepID=UPI002E77B163|nr:RICIN domain-containing protein [Streptomyces sp. SP17BM10]MEE1782163.1 RICIN domain-containing protein [Streptomyces sp. SP17BM10]
MQDNKRKKPSARGKLLAPLCAALLTAAACVGATGTASAAGDTGEWLVNSSSRLCADAPGYSKHWGTHVDQWDCVSQTNELWIRQKVRTVNGKAYYLLKNTATRLCMNVDGAGHGNGAAIIEWGCMGAPDNELWHPILITDNSQEWVNLRSGKCLTVAGDADYSGAWLIQYDCGRHPNQIWITSGG